VSKEISQLVMFVTFFLPGIISSTVFFYVADVAFSEFFFCVASVIFGLLNILMLTIIISLLGLLQKGCQNAGLLRPRTVARFDDLAVHQLIAFAVAISIVISPIMAYAYDEGLLLRSLNLVMEKVNMPISKLHQDGPLHYILRAFRYDAEEQNDAIRRTLERRPRKHFSTSIGVYVRIYEKENARKYYEGIIAVRPTRADRVEFFLGAACSVQAGRSMEPVRGPGVFIPEDYVGKIKLLDFEESECARFWFFEDDDGATGGN
jgi:hypothetical protein